jgi:hypothetical protein
MIDDRPLEHRPLAIFAVALVLQWFGAYLGHVLRKPREPAHGAVAGPAAAAPNAVNALAMSGMNDILNSESHTDAAWRRHVLVTARVLMGLIAFAGNLLLGASAKRKGPAILISSCRWSYRSRSS